MSRFATRLILSLLVAAPAGAADFVVTRQDDPSPGACNADCSLREAVLAANLAPGADTITVPGGTYALTLAGADEVANAGDLDIQGAVTINGAGANATIIDGAALGRIFHVDPEGDGNIAVTLRNLTVRNGAEAFGGAILSLATLTLDGVTVRDSVADLGAGIYALRPITIVNSTIRNNTTRTEGFGGGIRVDNATIAVSGSLFEANGSDRDGAAMYLVNTGGTIASTTFSNNVSQRGGGGAIEAFGPMSQVAVSASFIANRANDGGAITLLEGPGFTFTDATFQGNTANGTDLNGGGAIFLFNANATFNQGSFTSNTAFGEGGGAILAGGGAAGSTVTVNGTTFDGNEAVDHAGPLPGSNPGLGGALLVISGSRLNANGATFQGNTGALAGGAAYIDRNVTATFVSTQFVDNEATQQFGGAISSEGSITIDASTLRANTAGIAGGAISSGFTALTIEDSALDGNSAPTAGAIWNTFTSALVVRRTGFSGNTATGTGGSSGLGGAILLENGPGTTMPEAQIDNVTFTGNAAREGGALTLAGTNATSAALVHTTFAANTATVSGSAIRVGPTGAARIKGSIVAGTCGLQGSLTSGGRNLESTGNTCGFSAAGDAASVSAGALALAPAACNGGTGRTHALNPGSLARDRVPVAACTRFDGSAVTLDQRSVMRPQEGDGAGAADCDAGAFEVGPPSDVIFAHGFEDTSPGSTGASACL